MNSTLVLIRQPTPVLIAFFNQISYKTDSDGNLKPVCIQICDILTKRGYDIKKLNHGS
jgi:hypothetical protein